MARKPKKKGWTVLYSTGNRGSRVSIVTMAGLRNLYVRWWRGDVQEYGYRSLGHADLGRAEDEAHEMSEGRRKADVTLTGRPTIAGIFTRYETERTPEVGARRQKEHRRYLDRWQRYLGPDPALEDLPALVRKYERARLEQVRARQVEVEVHFLMAVLRWAAGVNPEGGRILAASPLEGHKPPVERNPRRPVSTWHRWLRTYRYVDRVDSQRYLRTLLVLVYGLGWRVTALCELRACDVDLRSSKTAPYGRILKGGETDKQGVERWVPLTAPLRRALRRHLQRRPVVGEVWLFPAPRAVGKPWTKDHAQKLHRQAQGAAGLATFTPPAKGGKGKGSWLGTFGFHAYRRQWATERKHLPRVDVAYAGAWLDPRTLDIYMHPDEATVMAVVEAGNLKGKPEGRGRGRTAEVVAVHSIGWSGR